MFDRLGWQRSLPLQGVCGPVAQLVEQRPFKAWVAGSNPARLTISNPLILQYLQIFLVDARTYTSPLWGGRVRALALPPPLGWLQT
jgi:hypothetical protein